MKKSWLNQNACYSRSVTKTALYCSEMDQILKEVDLKCSNFTMMHITFRQSIITIIVYYVCKIMQIMSKPKGLSLGQLLIQSRTLCHGNQYIGCTVTKHP